MYVYVFVWFVCTCVGYVSVDMYILFEWTCQFICVYMAVTFCAYVQLVFVDMFGECVYKCRCM